MDQSLSQSKQELDYLMAQMKNVFAIQAEQSDRLARLEHRQEGESRIKSVWGGQSPFITPMSDSSHQGSAFNPAAEAFKTFDQDASTGLLGNLHLDTEDEPRRGTSRANSVRFDESAIHGHFGPSSRSHSDIFVPRSSSALSSHPLTERSSSYKSDGRASSTHSARGSNIGVDPRPLSAAVSSFVNSTPTPGLLLMGPVPSIIRCWLDNNYSNDALLYAAVCTGSYKSTINLRLLQQLGIEHQITLNQDGPSTIKLPVALPEATIQQASNASAALTPQLPTLTTEFVVRRQAEGMDAIDIILGSDVLRFRNAEIYFSLDRLSLYDDERNKVAVPLVRPENVAIFQKLQTAAEGLPQQKVDAVEHDEISNAYTDSHSPGPSAADARPPALRETTPNVVPSPKDASPAFLPDAPVRAFTVGQTTNGHATILESEDGLVDIEGTDPGAGAGVWSSWRRDSSTRSGPDGISFPPMAPTSGYQKPGRGRGMKILKPSRAPSSNTTGPGTQRNTSRTRTHPSFAQESSRDSDAEPSSARSTSTHGGPGSVGEGNWRRGSATAAHVQGRHSTSDSGGHSDLDHSQFETPSGRVNSNDPSAAASRVKSMSGAPGSGPPGSGVMSTKNPVGGASAFGWLNGDLGKPAKK